MEVLETIMGLFKVCGLVLLCYTFYVIYIIIISPLLNRRYYSKFNNVCMSSEFNPPKFDLGHMDKLHEQNKYRWSVYLEFSDKRKDIHLCYFGYKKIFDLLSSKAFDDFDKLSPDKIDKFTDIQELSFAKTFFGAIMHQPTNENWKTRRGAFTKAIGLNFASRYISLMLEHAKILMDQWKVGDEFNFIPIIYKLTLRVISCILIGKDFDEKMKQMVYTNYDGTTETYDFYTFFPRLGKDLMSTAQKPLNLLFPTLIRNNIMHENKVNYKNILAFRQALKDFLSVTSDTESCYRQIQREYPEYNSEDLFNDLQGFLFDGYETLSDCICTTIFFLKKAPNSIEKLTQELKTVGIEQNENLVKSITYNRLQEMNYLLMIIKESLRIDPPLARSMHYYAKEDIEICGVPLPKGSVMSMCYIVRHYDPDQWHTPYKYIPERFDPESEFYFTPGENPKARDQRAFVAFSNSVRRCPAPTFSYLELKVFLSYIFSRFEYEIDSELLKCDDVRYGILSHFPLNIKITKVLC